MTDNPEKFTPKVIPESATCSTVFPHNSASC
jgi:hypothetical protein